MKNIIIVLIIIFSFYTVNAQDCMQIGTNFGGIDAQVFKDLKKSSTHFFTQNIVYLANDSNYWDTGLIDSIPTDLNGYPTVDIPFNHSNVDTSQMYHFIVAGNTVYPTGHYVLHFDGVGVLEISNWSDAQNITFPNSNTIEFDINTATNSGIHISVISSQATDYVRNITIVHEDDLNTFHSQPFREELITLAQDFENLRFMDWMRTNQANWAWYDTTTLTWGNRIPKGKHRVHEEHGGMSYEHIIEFTNTVNKDAWINIPHLADSNYIYQMATMFKNNMNEDLTLYVEFSNEVWNNIFEYMKADQLLKFNVYDENANNIYMLSWTLTQNNNLAFACLDEDKNPTSIEDITKSATKELANTIEEWKTDNRITKQKFQILFL